MPFQHKNTHFKNDFVLLARKYTHLIKQLKNDGLTFDIINTFVTNNNTKTKYQTYKSRTINKLYTGNKCDREVSPTDWLLFFLVPVRLHFR